MHRFVSRVAFVFLVCGALLAGCDSEQPQPDCEPVTCEAAGRNCGEIDDGCGGTATCGSCADGLTCGGSGTANVCGRPGCVPTTCEAQAKNCGEIDDGCGGTPTCGTCDGVDLCGGGGVPNVCGVSCAGCPAGWSCDESGLCTEGNPVSLLLDVRSATISGRVLHNGRLPQKTAACADGRAAISLRFVDASRGITLTHEILCETDDFSFTIPAFPGTYRMQVGNEGSSRNFRTDLPPTTMDFELPGVLTVEGDVNDLVIDVPSHLVKGKVSFDGDQPEPTAECTGTREAAVVRFRLNPLNSLAEVEAGISCTTTDFGFETRLYPGTWRVSVKNGGGSLVGFFSTLPPANQEYRSPTPLELSADVTNLAIDVPALAQVSGTVTHNGAPPVLTPSCLGNRQALRVHFHDREHNEDFVHNIPCTTTDFSFALPLFPAHYEVRVQNLVTAGEVPTDLPGTLNEYVVIERLELDGSKAGLVLDARSVEVSGRLTLDGATPQVTAACTDGNNAARITFRAPRGLSTTVDIPCSTTDFSFTTRLYAGLYAVNVDNVRNGSQWNSTLPQVFASHVVQEELQLAVDRSNLVLDVKVPPPTPSWIVIGKLTLRGALPEITEHCGPGEFAARVRFVGLDTSASATADIHCSEPGFLYATRVESGTYDVYVANAGTPFNSNLPQASHWHRVKEGLRIDGDIDELVLDVEPVRVAGSILVNGAQVVKTEACTGTRNAIDVRFRAPPGTAGPLFTFAIPCSSERFTFEGDVYPGVYQVTVENEEHFSQPRGFATTLPQISQQVVVVNRLELP